MLRSARHDYIELSYVYGGAVAVIIFLSLIAMPIDTSHFGLIVPKKDDAVSEIYAATAFDAVDVKAKSYVVYDLLTKQVIASKNAEEVLPLASISKLMMALTALSRASATTTITIRPGSIEGGYDLGLKNGQTWRLGELLKYTLVFSSNDGAHAIADNLGGRTAFVKAMNDQSALRGLAMVFTDPAGLDEEGKIGGMGSALDVAKLLAIVRRDYPEILDATTKTRVTTRASNGLVSGIPNTNQDIENFFGAEVSKTGFTDSAGGNLGIVVDVALGHPVAIVVLGSTHEDRFSDMEVLYKALVASLK
jgi:D-alanyl-D-alanine carboxypeptidase